ncbi:MAG: tellurite resistance TerB C-terminal domain-containing protein, partial [Myxococcota bacterium]
MQELFAIRYAQSFGEGLLVKPNKKRLELLYSPANPSLREERIRLHGPDLPDPFSLRGPMGKLSSLWSACVSALEPHQRYVRNYKQQEESVRALALLPKELIVNSSWAKMVSPRLQARVRDDSDPLTVKQLCELLEKPLPACLNKQQVTALCVLLEHLGFGCAPDPRVYQQRMVSDTPVVLFAGGHGGKTLPSAAFQTTAETIRFGAFVAQTCGVTQRARDVPRRHIDTRRFNPPQRNSLTAWSAWCFAVRQTMSGSRIKKLADVSQEARAALCGVVAAMARLVPRSVAPERIRKLQKIYKSLDLDEKQALIDMHRAVANEEPVMVMQRDPARTFAIPRSPHPDAAVTSKELRLDADLIRRRRQETAAVKNVLQDIFASEDPAGHGTQEADGVDQGEEGELDIPHRRLLRELITQEQWPQGELDAKCRALNLMTDGALETLNEWSLRQADALIVHNGDPICVDIAVAREILNHDGA